MAAQDLQFPAAGRIPQPRGLVLACGHHRLAIGRELRAENLYPHGRARPAVPGRWPHPTAVRSCPQLAVTTVLPSGENCALSTAPSWPRKDLQLLAAGHIPQPRGLVLLAVTTVLPSGENCALLTERLMAAQNASIATSWPVQIG